MIDDSPPREERRFLAGFALVSLAVVGIGCVVAGAHGVPTYSWIANLVAWLVGARTAWVMGTRRLRLPMWVLLAPSALLATLLAPGQQGVHRWLSIGPIHVNPAALLLPAAVVELAVLDEHRWTWLAAAATLGLLVLQPDASQAAAIAAGMLVILATLRAPILVRASGAAVVVLAVAAACLRPDPLTPVPEVEGIIGLAHAWSPIASAVAVILLVAAALYPLRLASRSEPYTPALALAVCFAVEALAPAFGAFPVPLVGMGMSPILGFWLGIGALAAAHRSAS